MLVFGLLVGSLGVMLFLYAVGLVWLCCGFLAMRLFRCGLVVALVLLVVIWWVF